MSALLRAEFRKLWTVRTTYWLLIGIVAVQLLAVFTGGEAAVEAGKPLREQQSVFFGAFLGRLFVLVLAIRAVTDEFRFGTIVPSLLVSPNRYKLIAAKAIALTIAGLVFAAVAEAALMASAYLKLRSEGAELVLGDGAIRSLAGTVAAGGVWALLGVGIGAVVKHQLIAVVGSIAWLISPLEDAVASRWPDVGEYLPGKAGLELALAPTPRALWLGALVLGAWALAAAVAGSSLTSRRDIA